MFPIPHLLLFVPVAVLSSLLVTAMAVNFVAGLAPRLRARQAARPVHTAHHAPLPSAQIIYFRPRKTSLPSTFGIGVRQRAMPR